MIKNQKNKINDVVKDSIQNLSSIIDVNTVVGTPIAFDGSTVVPVAKVTFCVLAGGGEYGKVSIFKGGEDLPFSAGNGSVISIKPCGFLVKNENEDYKVLSVSGGNLDGIIDKTTDLIKNLTKTTVENNDEENS